MFALWSGNVLLEWGFPSQRAAVNCGLRVLQYCPPGTVFTVEHWLGMTPVETDSHLMRALTDCTPVQAHIICAGEDPTIIMTDTTTVLRNMLADR